MKVDIKNAPLGTIVYSMAGVEWDDAFDAIEAADFAYVVAIDGKGERCYLEIKGSLRIDGGAEMYHTLQEAIDAAVKVAERDIEHQNSLIQRLNDFKCIAANSPSSVPVPPPFEPNRS